MLPTEPLPGPEQDRWFTEEVHRHERSVRSYLHHSFPAVREVEDLVQESCLRVWRAKSARPIQSAKAFLAYMSPPPLIKRRRSHVLVLFALLLGATTTFGAERLLFLDPATLQQAHGVTLGVNPVARSEPVIRIDRPWEGKMISFYTTVLEEDGRLRMWYICRDADNSPNLAYAESRDGLRWEKPNLGLVDYRGSKDNNLVGVKSLDGAVFKDPQATAAERYGYLAHVANEGVFRFTSPDGFRWRRDTAAFLPFRADTQNVVVWDERSQRYAVYLRAWDVGKVWTDRLRKVVRLETADLARPAGIKPSGRGSNPTNATDLPRIADEIPTVLAVDAQDPKGTDVYTISAQRYPLDPRWYVGFPSFFRRDKNISDGRLEVQFIGGRDGVAWHRYDRVPFVPPGLDGSVDANMTFIGPGMVVRGDEVWLFGVGLRHRHGDTDARRETADGTIFRHVIRVDGFVSLNFAATGGTCRVGPLAMKGTKLLLNLDTGALGDLRVGLVEPDGKPIAGFGLDQCEPLQVNSTHAIVTWKGKGHFRGGWPRGASRFFRHPGKGFQRLLQLAAVVNSRCSRFRNSRVWT